MRLVLQLFETICWVELFYGRNWINALNCWIFTNRESLIQSSLPFKVALLDLEWYLAASSTVTLEHNFHWTAIFTGLQLTMVMVVCNAVETFDLIPYFVWKKERLVTFQKDHDCHLSNPELIARNLQMFGRTLVNLARQSGPRTTIGKRNVKESMRWNEVKYWFTGC